MALLAACSSGDDASESNESALSGRWALPSEVLAVGAKVRITYEAAPKWTTTKACGGKLKPGGHVLGEYLMDHFPIVSSVGGYACRRNTANASYMSVHGTGRALDVFIPTKGGAADNLHGDKVANWLVKNAQSIGVQLIIWDRSVWRSNGTNASAYGGPIPHIDHVHVELTKEAAARTTRWFDDQDAGDASDVDGSRHDGIDPDDGADPTADDASTPDPAVPDAATPPKDAGMKKDAAPVDPPHDPDAATGPTSSPTGPANGTNDPTGDPTSGIGSAADEPGEKSSLPDRPAKRGSAAEDDAPSANGGCSASPVSDPTRTTGAGLAMMLGLGAWLRRRRRSIGRRSIGRRSIGR